MLFNFKPPKLQPWRRRCGPVRDAQARDSIKFPSIVGHYDQPARTGMACDHLVVGADRLANFCQLGSDHSGMRCAFIIKNFKPGTEPRQARAPDRQAVHALP